MIRDMNTKRGGKRVRLLTETSRLVKHMYMSYFLGNALSYVFRAQHYLSF